MMATMRRVMKLHSRCVTGRCQHSTTTLSAVGRSFVPALPSCVDGTRANGAIDPSVSKCARQLVWWSSALDEDAPEQCRLSYPRTLSFTALCPRFVSYSDGALCRLRSTHGPRCGRFDIALCIVSVSQPGCTRLCAALRTAPAGCASITVSTRRGLRQQESSARLGDIETSRSPRGAGRRASARAPHSSPGTPTS
jgi:hypothetical protein